MLCYAPRPRGLRAQGANAMFKQMAQSSLDQSWAVEAAEQALAGKQPRGPGGRSRWAILRRQLPLLLDPIGTVGGRFARYGDAYLVPQRGHDLYVFRGPEHVQDVLVTHAAAFDKQHTAFHRLSEVLGDALLTSEGERWRRQRRLVQPAFARPRLAQYGAVMVEEAASAVEQLVARAAAESGGLRVDLSREINALTLRIVTRTLFGEEAKIPGVTAEVIQTARTGAAMQAINRYFGLPDVLLRAWPPAGRRFEAAQRDLNDAVQQLIAARRQSLGPDAQPSDLLSALMLTRDEQGQALTQEELRDQLLTLYVAGHETTSHALSWTFYLLSQHPDVRARLDAEHARVLGGRLPTFEDLAALPYTEQVLNEALRLYPPVFAIPRRAQRDVRVGEYAVPKGSEVLLWIYYTQRDPRYYEEPERFMPERFASDVVAQRPKYAYAPFGAGQRACIGQLFALQEAQLVLATWLPRLRLEYAGRKAPRLRTGVTLAPRGGLPMRVHGVTHT